MMNAENLKIEQDNIAKEILSISPSKNGGNLSEVFQSISL